MARARSEAAQPKGVAPSGIDVLDRAVAILLVFRTGDGPLTLTEIAALTGLYKSTVLRLAAALVHHRLLVRLDDNRYQLGALNYTLGLRYEANLHLGDLLLPIMRELNERLGETISFHVRERDARVCLFRVNSRFSVRAEVKPGDIQALDRGAGGRVLLAFNDAPGAPYDDIRRDYHYVSIGERDPETAGISAPVFGPMQKLIGAVGIVTPVTRMKPEHVAPFRLAVLDTAAKATERLGGNAEPIRETCERLEQPQSS